MYHDPDDDPFLAPESIVSLPFNADSEDDSDWDIDYGDASAHVERAAYTRSAALSDRFGGDLSAFDTDSEERPMTLSDAIRLAMDLP